MKQDKHGRNPLHYAAMSQYTKCYRTVQAFLACELAFAPENSDFLKLYFEIAGLDSPDLKPKFDPRKTATILDDFKELMLPIDFKKQKRSFSSKMQAIVKQAMAQTDRSSLTPLHIASYFGDYKISKYFVDLGADPMISLGVKKPLEIAKNKPSRDVLQSLNCAAYDQSSRDLKFLVNCGEDIDTRHSIVQNAPIHRAV